MGIGYLPGWADEISGNLNKLVGHLPGIIEPNTVAHNRFQEMVQKDPSLILKLGNMSPEDRASFASSLGFKDGTPGEISSISEGNDIIDRRNEQKAIATDPEGYWNQKLGVRTAAQKAVAAMAPEATQAGIDNTKSGTAANNAGIEASKASTLVKGQEAELNKYVLKEKADAETLEAQLKVKFPHLQNTNIPKLVHDDIYGKADPQLVLAVNSDKALKSIYDSARSTAMTRMELQTRMAIGLYRQPEDKFAGLQRYEAVVKAQQDKLNNTSHMLSAMKLGEIAMEPDTYARLQTDYVTQKEHVDELQTNLENMYTMVDPNNRTRRGGSKGAGSMIAQPNTGDPNGEGGKVNFLSSKVIPAQSSMPKTQTATPEHVANAISYLKTNPNKLNDIMNLPSFTEAQKLTIRQSVGKP